MFSKRNSNFLVWNEGGGFFLLCLENLFCKIIYSSITVYMLFVLDLNLDTISSNFLFNCSSQHQLINLAPLLEQCQLSARWPSSSSKYIGTDDSRSPRRISPRRRRRRGRGISLHSFTTRDRDDKTRQCNEINQLWRSHRATGCGTSGTSGPTSLEGLERIEENWGKV